MLRRPAGRLIWIVSAASFAAGAGAVATAKPAESPPALTPTAALAGNGAATAPEPAVAGGGAEAPAAASPPSTGEPAPEAAPEETPLIDITPQPTAAPALAPAEELRRPHVSQETVPVPEPAPGPGPDQEQDDGDVLIPVQPDDVPADDGNGDPAPPAGGDPAAQGPASADALPLTGRRLTAPLGSGLLLLVLGFGLRILVGPSASLRARA